MKVVLAILMEFLGNDIIALTEFQGEKVKELLGRFNGIFIGVDGTRVRVAKIGPVVLAHGSYPEYPERGPSANGRGSAVGAPRGDATLILNGVRTRVAFTLKKGGGWTCQRTGALWENGVRAGAGEP